MKQILPSTVRELVTSVQHVETTIEDLKRTINSARGNKLNHFDDLSEARKDVRPSIRLLIAEHDKLQRQLDHLLEQDVDLPNWDEADKFDTLY